MFENLTFIFIEEGKMVYNIINFITIVNYNDAKTKYRGLTWRMSNLHKKVKFYQLALIL